MDYHHVDQLLRRDAARVAYAVAQVDTTALLHRIAAELAVSVPSGAPTGPQPAGELVADPDGADDGAG